MINGKCASWLLLIGAVGLAASAAVAAAESPVKVWEQEVTIPTYLAGEPEPNPMFYFGKASQGAAGRVYPYPLYDTLTHQKVDKTYRMVYLENEYLRLGIMPEIGGRIFEGVDKSNGYNFFYRQHVIKPALIGLIGAWISGGVEWNIPHHHRASTFIPVQHRLQENADGSKTVWVGELELRHRMRWAVGYTLRPGKSYLEASVRIVNRTPVVNTMLCFANVAVHVDETYQVIFPPSTQYATHHSKREFTTWPIATSRYGGYDFSRGVDVSWFTNHVEANSMFAWNYEDDFLAGYDHGKNAGLLSVADHHLVPGKKLWTWGNGARGRMWDRILTDQDGPYIELMVGAYSDNQPDYSWLQPFEVKSFEMYWYPFRDIDGVKNANLDAAVNLEMAKDGAAQVGFHTTTAYAEANVTLKAGNQVLLDEKTAISPGKPFLKRVAIPAGVDEHDLRAAISAEGKELVAYTPVRLTPQPKPQPVVGPLPPKEIKTAEELYLAGLRLEQFHDASRDPVPYWEEALSRDPGDARANTALGIRYFKEARYADAEKCLRQAIERLTANYTTPKDAEAIYYLGAVLKAQGRQDEAFKTLYQATWGAAWRSASYGLLAEIATQRGNLVEAMNCVERSLEANALDIRSLNLRAALLRRLGRPAEGLQVLDYAARKVDPLDARSQAERWLASRSSEDKQAMAATLNQHPATAQETAAEYFDAGLWQDGLEVLRETIAAAPDPNHLSPLVYYYLGYFADKLGRGPEAADAYRSAAAQSPEYVFPFQFQTIAILKQAIAANPKDARAPYYLGNLLFDGQPDAAVKLWEQAAALDPSFPIVHRNLAIAYSHQTNGNSLERAIASLETAVALPHKYPAHFAELDELYEAVGAPPEKRLALLEQNQETVARRDGALSRAIGLQVVMGKYDEAIRSMTGREFAVWEGGTLSVAESWTDAHLWRGQSRFAAKEYALALADFQTAGKIPDNLPSDNRGGNARQAELAYWIGAVYEAMGEGEKARQSWQDIPGRAGGGDRGFSGRNVQRYYRALALRKLGKDEEATTIFRELVEGSRETIEKPTKIEAVVSLSARVSQRSRLANAHHAAGLGYWGQGENDKARQEFEQALRISPDHLGAKSALAQLR